MIVVNANYETLLHRQFNTIEPNKETFIVNHSGDYMYYDPSSGTSPLEFHSDYKMPPPEFITKIIDHDAEEEAFTENDHIDYFVRLTTDQNNKDAFLGVVLKVAKDKLLAGAYETRRHMIIISLSLIIITLMGTYGLALWFTQPLQLMTREILNTEEHKKEKEKITLKLPVHRTDEIGDLARAFERLTLALVESEAKARGIVENVNDTIINIDETGKIEMLNPAGERIFGYKATEVLGKNIKTLMPEPYQSEHDQYIKNYVQTGKKKIIGIGREVEAKRKDGSIFPMELSVSEVRFGGQRLFTAIIRDITDRKKDEAERERLIRELEVSNKELDNFAYVASHDLKAPLRVIDNASKWLEEDLAEHLDEDTQESLDLLRNRVGRMEKLLDDLLEYSRIGRASDDRFKEQINGSVLITNILELLSPPENFTVSIAPKMQSIIVNRMPLQQILLNLISNAIKHHDKDDGRIIVSVEEKGDDFVFTVKDNGPGIPEEFQEQVFKMFQTLKPRDQVEGSGMGLAMVYKNIEIYGGKITLKSKEGQGCTFRFTWPKHQQLH